MRTTLHVRVVSPVALTEQLTGRLATAPGVQNMVTGAGAVRRPVGAAGLSAQRATWRSRWP